MPPPIQPRRPLPPQEDVLASFFGVGAPSNPGITDRGLMQDSPQQSADILRNNGSMSSQRQDFVDDTIGRMESGDSRASELLNSFLTGEETRAKTDPWAQHYRDVGEAQSGAAVYNEPSVAGQRQDKQEMDLARIGEPSRVTGEYGLKRDTITTQGDIEKQRVANEGLIGAASMSGGGGRKPLPPGLIEKVAGGSSALNILASLRQKRPGVSIGPWAGGTQSFLQSVPLIPADKNFADFKAETDTLKNATIKQITGAAMSEPEAKRIMGQVPTENDKDVVWDSKADAMERITHGLNVRIGLLHSGVPAYLLDQIPVEMLGQQPELIEQLMSGGGTDDSEWEDVSQ